MAEIFPVIISGIQVAKKIVEFFKKRREALPVISANMVGGDRIGAPYGPTEPSKERIRVETKTILENTMKHGLVHGRLTKEQFNRVLNSRINALSRPSIFYRDMLIEMNSVLNRGLGKIDLYYTLISRSSRKAKNIVLLQSRLLLPRINKDLNKFLAIMKQLDLTVIAEIQNSFCGAFKECESTLEAQSMRLEDVQSVGADVSVSDIENWLHAYRDYIECCLEGVNKAITFA